ncbi:uncharacterized protein LOC143246978 isoform X2 [Tachypleus tridentatus]|uniref:uncharacterized protein LOC143246978 isoform X2 n=1 Tax=Tachypleus tridentatus TaxID=6853 RepID=UPI003FD379B3
MQTELEDTESHKQTQKKEECVKRGLHWTTNGFVIFCHRNFENVRKRFPHLENGNLTMVLQDWWTQLEPGERDSYTELAKQYEETLRSEQPGVAQSTSSKTSTKSTLKLELCQDDHNTGTSSPVTPEIPTPSSLNGHIAVSKPPKKRYVQNGTFKPAVEPNPESTCSGLLELSEGHVSAPPGHLSISTKLPYPYNRETFSRNESVQSCGPSNSTDRPEAPQNRQVYISMPMMEMDIASRIIDQAFSDKDSSQVPFSASRKRLSKSPSKNPNLNSSCHQIQSPPATTSCSSTSALVEEPLNLCKRQPKTFQTSQQKIINHVVDMALCGPFGNTGHDYLTDSIIGKWENQSQICIPVKDDTWEKLEAKNTRSVTDSSDRQDKPKSPFLDECTLEKDDSDNLTSPRSDKINKSSVNDSSVFSGHVTNDDVCANQSEDNEKEDLETTTTGHSNEDKTSTQMSSSEIKDQKSVESDLIRIGAEEICENEHRESQSNKTCKTDCKTKGTSRVSSKRSYKSTNLNCKRTTDDINCSSLSKLVSVSETQLQESCSEDDCQGTISASIKVTNSDFCKTEELLPELTAAKNSKEEQLYQTTQKRKASDISGHKKNANNSKDTQKSSDEEKSVEYSSSTQKDSRDLQPGVKKRKKTGHVEENESISSLSQTVSDVTHGLVSQDSTQNTNLVNQSEPISEAEKLKEQNQSHISTNMSQALQNLCKAQHNPSGQQDGTTAGQTKSTEKNMVHNENDAGNESNRILER